VRFAARCPLLELALALVAAVVVAVV